MIWVEALISGVTGRLTNVAASTVVFQGLENGLTAPHRYVWEPTTIDDATARTARKNQNPKLVSTDKYNFTVHCWGSKIDDCVAMRAALRQAMKEEIGARGSFEFGVATWAYPEWARVGFVLSQQIAMFVASVEMTLPAAPLDYPSQIDSNNYDTVTIAAVGNVTPTSTAGDGFLEQGED